MALFTRLVVAVEVIADAASAAPAPKTKRAPKPAAAVAAEPVAPAVAAAAAAPAAPAAAAPAGPILGFAGEDPGQTVATAPPAADVEDLRLILTQCQPFDGGLDAARSLLVKAGFNSVSDVTPDVLPFAIEAAQQLLESLKAAG